MLIFKTKKTKRRHFLFYLDINKSIFLFLIINLIAIILRHMVCSIIAINSNIIISYTNIFIFGISISKHALTSILVTYKISIFIMTLTRLCIFIKISPILNTRFIIQNIYIFLIIAINMISFEIAFFWRWSILFKTTLKMDMDVYFSNQNFFLSIKKLMFFKLISILINRNLFQTIIYHII